MSESPNRKLFETEEERRRREERERQNLPEEIRRTLDRVDSDIRSTLGDDALDRPADAWTPEYRRDRTPARREASPGFGEGGAARQLVAGVVEAPLSYAKILDAPLSGLTGGSRPFAAAGERVSEWAGEPTSGLGTTARIGGRVAAELALMVAGGGAARGVAAAHTAARAARGGQASTAVRFLAGANAPGGGTRASQAIARRAGDERRLRALTGQAGDASLGQWAGARGRSMARGAYNAAGDAAVIAPFDLTRSIASPDETMVAAGGELLDSDRLRKLAENPFTRTAAEVALPFGADAVIRGAFRTGRHLYRARNLDSPVIGPRTATPQLMDDVATASRELQPIPRPDPTTEFDAIPQAFRDATHQTEWDALPWTLKKRALNLGDDPQSIAAEVARLRGRTDADSQRLATILEGRLSKEVPFYDAGTVAVDDLAQVGSRHYPYLDKVQNAPLGALPAMLERVRLRRGISGDERRVITEAIQSRIAALTPPTEAPPASAARPRRGRGRKAADEAPVRATDDVDPMGATATDDATEVLSASEASLPPGAQKVRETARRNTRGKRGTARASSAAEEVAPVQVDDIPDAMELDRLADELRDGGGSRLIDEAQWEKSSPIQRQALDSLANAEIGEIEAASAHLLKYAGKKRVAEFQRAIQNRISELTESLTGTASRAEAPPARAAEPDVEDIFESAEDGYGGAPSGQGRLPGEEAKPLTEAQKKRASEKAFKEAQKRGVRFGDAPEKRTPIPARHKQVLAEMDASGRTPPGMEFNPDVIQPPRPARMTLDDTFYHKGKLKSFDEKLAHAGVTEGDRSLVRRGNRMTDQAQNVFRYILANNDGGVTAKDLAEHFDVKPEMIRRALHALKNEGLVSLGTGATHSSTSPVVPAEVIDAYSRVAEAFARGGGQPPGNAGRGGAPAAPRTPDVAPEAAPAPAREPLISEQYDTPIRREDYAGPREPTPIDASKEAYLPVEPGEALEAGMVVMAGGRAQGTLVRSIGPAQEGQRIVIAGRAAPGEEVFEVRKMDGTTVAYGRSQIEARSKQNPEVFTSHGMDPKAMRRALVSKDPAQERAALNQFEKGVKKSRVGSANPAVLNAMARMMMGALLGAGFDENEMRGGMIGAMAGLSMPMAWRYLRAMGEVGALGPHQKKLMGKMAQLEEAGAAKLAKIPKPKAKKAGVPGEALWEAEGRANENLTELLGEVVDFVGDGTGEGVPQHILDAIKAQQDEIYAIKMSGKSGKDLLYMEKMGLRIADDRVRMLKERRHSYIKTRDPRLPQLEDLLVKAERSHRIANARLLSAEDAVARAKENAIREAGWTGDEMIATHSLYLTDEAVEFLRFTGGMANPSVAIHRANVPMYEFGDTMLILRKDSVDPKRGGVEVFDTDVYTQRAPHGAELGFKGTTRELIEEVTSVLPPNIKESGDYELLFANPVHFQDFLQSGNDFLAEATYVITTGQRTSAQVAKAWDETFEAVVKRGPDFIEFNYDLAGPVFRESLGDVDLSGFKAWKDGIGAQFDAAERTGGKRFFNRTNDEFIADWQEYDLDVVSEYMNSRYVGRTKNIESLPPSLAGEPIPEKAVPVGNIQQFRAFVAQQFNSLNQMDKARQKLWSSKFDLENDLLPAQFNARDEIADMLLDYLPDGVTFNKYAMNKKLFESYRDAKVDFGDADSDVMWDIFLSSFLERVGVTVPDARNARTDALSDKISEFLDLIMGNGAKYFEAKFQRPVRLEEFAAAVVPDDTPREAVELLQNAGIEVMPYPASAGDDGKREAIRALRGGDRQKLEMEGIVFMRGIGTIGGAAYGAATGEDAEDRWDRALIGGAIGLGLDVAGPAALRGARKLATAGSSPDMIPPARPGAAPKGKTFPPPRAASEAGTPPPAPKADPPRPAPEPSGSAEQVAVSRILGKIIARIESGKLPKVGTATRRKLQRDYTKLSPDDRIIADVDMAEATANLQAASWSRHEDVESLESLFRTLKGQGESAFPERPDPKWVRDLVGKDTALGSTARAAELEEIMTRAADEGLTGGRVSSKSLDELGTLYDGSGSSDRRAILDKLRDFNVDLEREGMKNAAAQVRRFGNTLSRDAMKSEFGILRKAMESQIGSTTVRSMASLAAGAAGYNQEEKHAKRGLYALSAILGYSAVRRTGVLKAASPAGETLYNTLMAAPTNAFKNAVFSVNDNFGRFWFSNHGRSQEWLDMVARHRRETADVRFAVKEWQEGLAGMTPEMNKFASQVVDMDLNSFASADDFMRLARESGLDDAQAKQVLKGVTQWHDMAEGYGRELLMTGLLKDGQLAKNVRQWAPKLYEEFLTDANRADALFAEFRGSGGAKIRLADTGRTKSRTGVVEDLTKIEDFQFRTTVGILQEAHLVATGRFLKGIRSHADWTDQAYGAVLDEYNALKNFADMKVKRGEATPKEVNVRLSKLRRDRENAAATAERMGLKRLPETDKLGALSGQYVTPQVYGDVQATLQTNMDQWMGKAVDHYRKMLQIWKKTRTAWNPATHGRNIVGTQMLSWLGDGPTPFSPVHMEAATLMARTVRRGVKDLSPQQREMYDLARQHGVLDASFFRNQVETWGDNLRGAENLLDARSKQVGAVVSKHKRSLRRPFKGSVDDFAQMLYHNEDVTIRLAHFMDAQRRRGMSAAEAAADARKWVPEYRSTSEGSKWISTLAMPFWAFTEAALPLVAEATLRRPLRAMVVPGLAWSMGQIFHGEDIPNEILPDQMRGIGQWDWVPEPVRNVAKYAIPAKMPSGRKMEDGRMPFLDLSYVLPHGDIGLPIQQGFLKGVPQSFNLLSSPLADALVKVSSGTDPYTGRQFDRQTMTGGDRLKAYADMAHKSLLPTWSPGIPGITEGGYQYSNLQKAGVLPRLEDGKYVGPGQGMTSGSPQLFGDPTPNRWGHTRTPLRQIQGSILGLRQFEIDPKQEYSFRWNEHNRNVNEIRAQIRRIARDPAIPPATKQNRIAEQHELIRRERERQARLRQAGSAYLNRR